MTNSKSNFSFIMPDFPDITDNSVKSDADLITSVLIMNHGLAFDRYRRLDPKHRNYLRSLILCICKNLFALLDEYSIL